MHICTNVKHQQKLTYSQKFIKDVFYIFLTCQKAVKNDIFDVFNKPAKAA